ncbi:plasmid-related protein [Methylomonas koyamae]|uniref:plasmid-related protein n=1 Tax=Methylomonas koyamae TaxID=702114 RepID=UPI0009EDA399|nr:plasmid-related protein [Methylomonas koyamae]
MSIKDSGMRIRVEKELRDAFVTACREQDRVAADVLREFMRVFVDKQQGQVDLFVEVARRPK